MTKKMDFTTIKKLYGFITPNRKYLYLSLLFNAISVGCGLISTVFVGQAIDCMIAKNSVNFDKLIVIIIKIAVSIGILFFAEYLQGVFTQKLSYKTVNLMREICMKNIEKVPVSYIDSNDKGDILSRVVTDVSEISDGLLIGFTQLFNGVVTIVATLIIMFAISYKIAIIVALLTPLSLLVAKYIANSSASQFKLQAEKRGELTAFVDEMIGNQKIVKTFSKEEDTESIFSGINTELKECSTKATFYSSLSNPATRFVNNIVYVAVGIIGALSVIANPVSFTVGALSSFLLYANKYTKPFNEISGVVTELQSAFVSAKRVFEIMEAEPEIEDSVSSVNLENVRGNICFKNVYFSYDKERKFIEDFNLKVKAGQRIAIVGATGSGKTTLINLLMRFYDVDNGEIDIDKIPIKDIKRNSLRANFGMVLQETWLKKGTVKENIAYGKVNATEDEIYRAARNAWADSFIRRLPDGYDTIISEDSGNISEGQKQLLCIARVMLNLPPMLILDEATSSIDTRTEIKIQKAFDKMVKGRTSFVVAHRLSTIKNADVILVLDKGNVVEQGKHSELLEKQGVYYNIYNSQFNVT